RARRDSRRASPARGQRAWDRGGVSGRTPRTGRRNRLRSVSRSRKRRCGDGETVLRLPAYLIPSTAFLKSAPGAGSGPIHVFRIASAVALPGNVPLVLPFTSTVVPWPGT